MLSSPRSPYTLSDRCRLKAQKLGSETVQTHSVSPATSDFAPLHPPPPASPSSGYRALHVDEGTAGGGNLLGLSLVCESPLSPTSGHSDFGSALMEIDESEEEDTEQEGMHKEGASTPVYRSSTEPLEGFVVQEAMANQEMQELASDIRQKLQRGLQEGCEPIEVEVTLLDGELLISQNGRPLSNTMTLSSTYVEPLISILEPSSAADDALHEGLAPHRSHRRSSSGLFLAHSQPTLPIIIDLHPHSSEAFEYLRHELQPLRDLSLLTEYSPAANLVTRAPITLHLSDAASRLLVEEMGDRWIFRLDDERVKLPRRESLSPTDSGYLSLHRASEVEQFKKVGGEMGENGHSSR